MIINNNSLKIIKKVIYAGFLSITMIIVVVADDMSIVELQNRLKKINNFYAHFTQKVIDHDGNLLSEGHGELWVKRPNLFNWHMIFPEENFLISDGKTFWFYIPSIQQVTAYWLKSFSDNILFTFFCDNNMYKWNDYNIFQQRDCFSLIPISNNFNLKACKIKITNCGIIERLSIFEEKGQRVDYYLLDHNNNDIDISKFYFTLAEDIQLDEQRK